MICIEKVRKIRGVMQFDRFSINDLVLITPKIFQDERGIFFESFNYREFIVNGIEVNIAQQNQSGSKKNSLRGLHYQLLNSQGKLVRAIKGEIFDVAVDIRKSSPTFGKWQSVLLNEENRQAFWVPAGFAHGFYVMSDWAEVEYFTTDFYNAVSERTIIWNDPTIGILWPIEAGQQPILSEKDNAGFNLMDTELYE